MTKGRFCKATSAFLAVAILSSLCVFAACSDDEEKSSSSSSYGEVTSVTMTYERSEISVDGIALDEGETTTLSARVETTEGEYSGRLDWTSSDSSVADFTTAGGILEAKSAGMTEITVTARGTKVSDSVEVNVYEAGSVFVVGVKEDVKGFGYRDPVTGVYSGFEIDMAYQMGEELGFDKSDVVLMGVLPEDREEYLKNDVVDCVIATYTVTDEREDVVNFSAPYYEDYVGALIRGSYAENIDGTADDGGVTLKDVSEYVTREEVTEETFAPCRVGYVENSTAYDAFQSYLPISGALDLFSDFGDVFDFYEYEDYDACEKAINSGEIDLFVADHSILMSHSSAGTMLSDKFETADYAVGTKKEEEDVGETLTDKVNAVIDGWLAVDEDTVTSVMAKIIAKWIDGKTGTLITN